MHFDYATYMNILQILVLAAILAYFIVKKYAYQGMDSVFYIAGITAFLVSDVYWLTHLIMHEGETPWFSSAEFSDAGVLLLLGAVLVARVKENGLVMEKTVPEIIFGGIFAAANTAFWIGWTGAWVKDILSGVSIAYYFIVAVLCMKLSGVFPALIRRIFYAVCIVLLIFEAGTLVLHGQLNTICEILRNIIWFSGVCLFFGRTILSLARRESSFITMSAAFTGNCWVFFALYLSTGVLYEIFDILMTCSLALTFFAVCKEVKSR